MKLRDVGIVHDCLNKELGTLICDHVVAQVDHAYLDVLLKDGYEGLYGL